jgi:hypothetical protein
MENTMETEANEIDPEKRKHQERIGQKQNHIKKQYKIAKRNGGNQRYLKQPHRLAKHSAMDCGTPNCHLCGNRRRVWEEKTIQELKFEQTEKWNDNEREVDKLLGT